MIKTITYFFALVGIATVASAAIFYLIILSDRWKEAQRRRKYAYKKAHRFDGPPTAKCYCKDCIYGFEPYKDSGGYIKCSKGTTNHGEDSWFCADGHPRTYDPEEEVVE